MRNKRKLYVLRAHTVTYMPDNLEKSFYSELKKRKQQQKDKLTSQILSPFRSLFARLRQIEPRYLFGLTIFCIAIAHHYHLTFLTNPIYNLIASWRYQPTPPISKSPWSWSDHNQPHPLIAKIKPQTEKNIKSVADYIARNEPDPYLRVKAVHDYVISRVDYDLDVLTTSSRPKQDALTVFKTHKAVCEGYARLFQALNKAMGSEAVYLTGRVRQDLAPLDLIPSHLRLGTSKYDWTLHACRREVSNHILMCPILNERELNQVERGLGELFLLDKLLQNPSPCSKLEKVWHSLHKQLCES